MCQVFSYCLFIYVIPFWIHLLKGESWNPNTRFNTTATFCASHKPGPGFTTLYIMVVHMFNMLRWDEIIFVDICGIVDHYCLNTLIHYTTVNLLENVLQ